MSYSAPTSYYGGTGQYLKKGWNPWKYLTVGNSMFNWLEIQSELSELCISISHTVFILYCGWYPSGALFMAWSQRKRKKTAWHALIHHSCWPWRHRGHCGTSTERVDGGGRFTPCCCPSVYTFEWGQGMLTKLI